MILIDPPTWPAHGTVFSHLISSTSLQELHAFAAAAGVSQRAFDIDHYDVPVRIYAELVAAGATAVSGKELVRALHASGLRVKARHRPKSARTALEYRWNSTMLPNLHDGRAEGPTSRYPFLNHMAHSRWSAAVDALGQDLLGRWSEPHRHYHSSAHLLNVLVALDTLCSGEPPKTVRLAAWFHDAVYTGVAGQDEEDSAKLAQTKLQKLLAPVDVQEISRLVLLTKHHSPEAVDSHGALLCDADLSILGSDPADYTRYARAVRQDFAHVADHDFRRGRIAVLSQLLATNNLFRTQKGRELWGAKAVANLKNEIARLSQ